MANSRTKRTPKKGWHPKFLAALTKCGQVGVAARKAGVGRTAVYEHRNADPEFAAAWDAALENAVDDLLEEARRRAHDGTLKPVYQGGKKVGEIREYSDTLLIFLIKGKRPEYRDQMKLEHGGRVQFTPLEKLTDAELDQQLADLAAKRAAAQAGEGETGDKPADPGLAG